jgi:endonuclease YncB( thermonuclease family)
MSEVRIFWDPNGFELSTLGDRNFLKTTDGDTPSVSVPIRMLSIDAPEVHYPDNKLPSSQDKNLAQLAEWIVQGIAPIDKDLGKHLYPKLATGAAGTLHEEQGKKAKVHFEELLDRKLALPNGKKRNVFLRAADEKFDQYGRLLAYMAPNYSAKELNTMSRTDRASFNYLMVESGWAATFIIYPSIPSYLDLVMLQELAKNAYQKKIGAWSDVLTLTGYEYRMMVRLHEITKQIIDGKNLSSKDRYSWIDRYCADMTTQEIFFPQDYFRVETYNRIFIWPADVAEAVGSMNLGPVAVSI